MQGLSILGYEPLSYNVKELFIKSGFNRDLHLYSCDIVFTDSRIIMTFNSPIAKHRADTDYVSNYLPPLVITLEKKNG